MNDDVRFTETRFFPIEEVAALLRAAPARDPSYGDEQALRSIGAAADAMRNSLVRNVPTPDARKEAIALINQATVVAFAAIRG